MTITLEIRGDVALIQIDDGKANAVNPNFVAAMNEHLDTAEMNAKAIVVAGRPGMFCGGFDLKILQNAAPEDVEDLIDKGGELALRLFTYPKPVVMACSGHAIAQGAAYLLSADLRLGAAGDFKIGLNETQIDMVLRHFGPTLAKARIPLLYQTRAAIIGELFSPEACIDVGYLDEVTASDQLIETALERAQTLAGLPTHAFFENKKLMRRAAIAAMEAKVPL